MGQRMLRVSPRLLVELLTAPGETPRWLTVEHPLPADVRVVRAIFNWVTKPEDADVFVLLESEAWEDIPVALGESYPDVEPTPVATAHFGEPVLPSPSGGPDLCE